MNHKRITEPKRNTFFAKGALISMLVFCVGTGSAFASGEAADPIPSPTVTTNVSAEGAVSESKTPNLLPGDFFYFIKVVYENIRLSITADDLKEAGLLAKFAQERLSEATALHAKGETEKSEQVLQKSFENQQLAIELVASETEEENEDKDLKQVVEVKSDLQHNILSLTAALEKVKNPQAQKSLLKNIIKSFGHLEKKLTKLENKASEEKPSEPLANQTIVPADENPDTVVSSDAIAASSIKTETEQKTVSNKDTKPEKEAKSKETKSKEAKNKEIKTNKEAKIEKEAKNEKKDMLIKLKKEHENNRVEKDQKNHNNK